MDFKKYPKSTHGFHMSDDLCAKFMADVELWRDRLKFPKAAPIERLLEFWLTRSDSEKEDILNGRMPHAINVRQRIHRSGEASGEEVDIHELNERVKWLERLAETAETARANQDDQPATNGDAG